MKNIVTIVITAVATGAVSTAHLWMPFIPPQYAGLAAAAVATISAIYHLRQPSPVSK